MEDVDRPGPEILFGPVYASQQPWTLAEQQAELREHKS